MNPERWQEVQKIYLGAVGLDEVARTSFLERMCSGDPSLKQEVDSLLSFDNKMEGFLEQTAVEVLAQMYGADKTVADTVVLDDFIGTVIDDRYVVSKFIGAGGMGDVYRADHRLMGTPVAIKRLASRFRDRQDYRQRFIDEARHAVLLDHENVTGIKDVVEQSGEVFVVMEFIDGQTLRTRLDHPFGVDEFLDIAIQCASALTAAHNERIVHLDIKPANIMLTGSQKVKVCDFGVARQLAATGEDGNNGSAAHWKLAGTPAYMAPEVIKGNQFDARADIFSLGVVFYEMLAGKHPFRAEDLKATTNRIIMDDPPPISLSNRKLPRRLIRLLDAMLAKAPDRRIGSTADVLRELQIVRLQHNFLRNTWRGFTASVKRRPLAWAAAALILVIAVAGTIYFEPISIVLRHSSKRMMAVQLYTQGHDLLNEYYKPENIDASIDLFDRALKLDSTYAEAYANLGEAYSMKYENTTDVKLLQSAMNACLNSRTYDKTLAEAHVCLGTVAQQRGKFEDAAAEYKIALKSDPNADSAHRGLARALDSQGKFEEAKEQYLKAIEKNPNYWASHSWFGEFYYKREMFDDAIKQFETASALSPNNGRVYYSLGTPYFLNGQFDKAIEYFEKALEKQPYLTRAANNLGAAYFLRRSYDKAIPILKDAVDRSEGSTKDYLEAGNLARAYFWSGNRKDSFELYKHAIDRANTHLEANPGNADDHLAIALYNAMLSEETRAMTNLEIALRGHDQDAHSLETAAWVYVQFKKYETAFESLERARSLGLKPFKIKADPELDALRVSDPKRYDKLLANK